MADDIGGTQILAKPTLKQRGKTEVHEACIILIHPPGANIGKRTRLIEKEYLVGREIDSDFVVDRSSVSRHHARLKRGRGAWTVEDLDSTNGTFVNEERVSDCTLRDGDQIRFGDAIFKFLVGSNVESAYHEEIYRMTIQDGLTGIHNKRYFLDFLDREVSSAHRHNHPLTLVMFDIDHFKRINDERGHLAGDSVLKELARRIQPRIRREDLFARYGGEEFSAILPATPLIGGVRFAHQLRTIIEKRPFEFEGDSFQVTISLGVGCMAGESIGVRELIQRADENLYEAKRLGRNCIVPSLSSVKATTQP